MEGNKKMVELLLEHGANINEKDLNGNTALTHALQYHGSWGRGNTCKGIVTMLIEKGADVTVQDNFGKSVYELTVERHWENLLPKDVLASEKEKYTARMEEKRQAKEKYEEEYRERMQSEEAERQQRAEKQKLQEVLLFEISHDNVKGIEDVLARGADVNAAVDGEFPIIRACSKGKPEIVKLLLEKGAKVDVVDERNNNLTALHFAADKGRLEVVQLLLEHKADVNAKTTGGNTPLMKAVWDNKLIHTEYMETAKLLIEAGADVAVENSNGDTVFSAIANNPILMELVLKKGLNFNAVVNDRGRTLLMVAAERDAKATEKLLDAGANVHAVDEEGRTALYHAAMKHNADTVKLLLERGAKVGDILDEYGGMHGMHFPMHPFDMEMCWMRDRMRGFYGRGFDDKSDKKDKVYNLLKEAKEKESTPENMRKALEVLQNAGSLVVIVPLQNITDEFKSQLSALLSQHGITFVKKDAEVAAEDASAKVKAAEPILNLNYVRDEIRAKKWEMVNKLMPEIRDQSINEVDAKGRTLLMEAVQHGAPYDTVKLLLEKGVNPNTVDLIGYTALKMAKKSPVANEDLIALLIEHGAKE
jgi:ankyrin repeat protein